MAIEIIDRTHPWRRGYSVTPPRAIIATNGRTAHCLYFIGAALHFWKYEVGIDIGAEFDHWDVEPGVYVVECRIKGHLSRGPDGDDYDEELELISYRSATDDEMRALRDDEHPWDPGLWFDSIDGELLG